MKSQSGVVGETAEGVCGGDVVVGGVGCWGGGRSRVVVVPLVVMVGVVCWCW